MQGEAESGNLVFFRGGARHRLQVVGHFAESGFVGDIHVKVVDGIQQVLLKFGGELGQAVDIGAELRALFFRAG